MSHGKEVPLLMQESTVMTHVFQGIRVDLFLGLDCTEDGTYCIILHLCISGDGCEEIDGSSCEGIHI